MAEQALLPALLTGARSKATGSKATRSKATRSKALLPALPTGARSKATKSNNTKYYVLCGSSQMSLVDGRLVQIVR